MTAQVIPIKEQVSPEEWQVRVDLAALYRIIAMHGWDDLIFTHISARVPGEDHHFLINPYGMMFEEITASSLVKVDIEGNKVVDSEYDINPAGFTIHSAIHEVRHDANCVIHVHTRAGIAVSAQKNGLLPISQQSSVLINNLSYHDYEGIALFEEEKARLQNDLGKKSLMILRNHGTLALSKDIPNAFLGIYSLESACQIQIAAQSSGAELIMISDEIVQGAQQTSKDVTRGMGGSLAWPGLLRKLDRTNPGYRD